MLMKWLENDVIRLRAMEPDDLEQFYIWENDTELWEFGSTLAPYSRYVLKSFLQNTDADIYSSKQLRLMIVLKSSGETVGTVDLFDFDPHHRRAGIGILIDAAYHRKGFGKEALSLLTTYAFEFLNIHQLYAYVPVLNQPSMKLFTRAGFQSYGILKEWLHTHRGFADVDFMALVNKEQSFFD